jgi:hypothetical protein
MPWKLRSHDRAITAQPESLPGSSAAISQPSSASALAPAGGTSSRFLLSLVLVTCVPLIFLPLVSELSLLGSFGGGMIPTILLVAVITGPVHVACTAFFYFDLEFRPVLRESPIRCLWSPALVPLAVTTVGVVAAIWVGPWAFLLIGAFHNIWLFYHYQRQNFGLISFMSTHFGSGRLPSMVNTALNLAALGGALCLLGDPEFYLISEREEPLMNRRGLIGANASMLLRGAGTIIYALSVLLMIGLLWLEKRLRSNGWVIGALFLSLAFFLPPVLFTSLFAAFLPLAIAHGAQYLLMMGVVSGRSSRSWLGLGLIFAACVGAGLTLNTMTDWTWPYVLIGIGLVQVHFLVDAKVWRLREPRQREIMNDRFDFFLAS